MSNPNAIDLRAAYSRTGIERIVSPNALEYLPFDPCTPASGSVSGLRVLSLALRSHQVSARDLDDNHRYLDVGLVRDIAGVSYASLERVLVEKEIAGSSDFVIPAAMVHEVLPPLKTPKKPEGERERWLHFSMNGGDEFVKSIATKYRGFVGKVIGDAYIPQRGMDFEDALSYGTEGLMKAIRRYDVTGGADFMGFAAKRVKGEYLDAIRSGSFISRTAQALRRDYLRAHQILIGRLDREPHLDELAAEMGVDLEHAAQGRDMSLISYAVSLDDPLNRHIGGNNTDADSDETMGDRMLEDESADILSRIEERELSLSLGGAFRELPGRERQVLRMYFADELKMSEIAVMLGVSETRISQLFKSAVQRLRGQLFAAGFINA